MGIGDNIRDALTPGFVKKINTALSPTPPIGVAAEEQPSPVEAKTPQQLQYEAKEKAMNANNPGYVPRAKGGPVKAGGAPKFKNVDNSGLKKEPC